MSKQNSAGTRDIAAILGSAKSAGFYGFPQYGKWIVGAVIIVLLIVGFVLLKPGSKSQGPQYRTEKVTKGDLMVTVSATGKLQPTNQVDVGSEISGTIRTVLVEDNDRVQKGQVLARLDPSVLEQRVLKSQAALLAAKASVMQAQATAEEARADLARLQQVAELSGGKVPSKTELDAAAAALKRAEATEAGAIAAVGQAEATLKSDETDLSKSIIRSPIDGIILSRKIEPGQTVAASLSAPILFTIAENLSQMELEVHVDEADVGMVNEGQSATFGVNAWPNRKYSAKVKRLAYGSRLEENVVTYPALLTVNNSDLSLRPGMTATADIVTADLKDALLVPNAALRFNPSEQSQGARRQESGSFVSSLMPRMPRQTKEARVTDKKGREQNVYVLKQGVPTVVPLIVGVTNGRLTEVISGDIDEESLVIVEGGRP
ncbi:MAG: efflux RND transporter periplasmic adaptor subunit [Syntrophorhabdaceae bacterium]|nr:efflux RND transporter periplasmic adaptor subunit [Syntrophorhabdaceae bacterium]